MLLFEILTVILSYYIDVRAFFPTIIQFFRLPLNVLVRTPVVRPTSGWESLLYNLMFFLTVHHSIDFSKYQLSAQFF